MENGFQVSMENGFGWRMDLDGKWIWMENGF